MWQWLIKLFSRYSTEDKELAESIYQIVGKYPVRLSLYKLAFSHASASVRTHHTGLKESNERLEYLGDAILGAIVAEYLFKKYPFEDEGFLTEIRSRMVNRETLNEIARKMGIDELIQHDQHRRNYGTHRSMNGDALEALVGAVYLERGFKFCQLFVLNRLIHNYYDLNQVIANNKNFKSTLIEWSQREGKELRFELVQEINNRNGYREFVVDLIIDKDAPIRGRGLSKKKAEQAAAEKACQMFGVQ
jgi:ribonuclease-3